ncbi:MAG: lipoyl(octanoyl) transferase LipB [Ignavibacteria bacterium]|nr:lipoyl(octanoyl) transferase LipB [Ignavibacteria bacterium]
MPNYRELLICQPGNVDYQWMWDFQKRILEKKKHSSLPDVLFLLEHPHTYTLGKVAHRENLLLSESELQEKSISVFDIDRGGDITYHGPGQIVGYPIIDLKSWHQDSHKYLRGLEEVLIRVTALYGLTSGRIEGLTGVWIENRKIAAIGIKISSWITMHGFAYNACPDLNYFHGIIPCGITDKEVTSLTQEIKVSISTEVVKKQIVTEFTREFNYTDFKGISVEELQTIF